MAGASLLHFEPTFCSEVFSQMRNRFCPVRSSFVNKTSNLLVPGSRVSTLRQPNTAWKKVQVHVPFMPTFTPTSPSGTDNETLWPLAQKHCSELLEDKQTWNPETGVLSYLDTLMKHQVDDRGKRLEIFRTFCILVPKAQASVSSTLFRGVTMPHLVSEYCFVPELSYFLCVLSGLWVLSHRKDKDRTVHILL